MNEGKLVSLLSPIVLAYSVSYTLTPAFLAIVCSISSQIGALHHLRLYLKIIKRISLLSLFQI